MAAAIPPEARPSLEALGRCARTGGKLVCIGHFDYFGTYMVWTRHYLRQTDFKVIPYDHCAPEAIASHQEAVRTPPHARHD